MTSAEESAGAASTATKITKFSSTIANNETVSRTVIYKDSLADELKRITSLLKIIP